MNQTAGSRRRWLLGLAGVVLANALFVLLFTGRLPRRFMLDYLCYWAAGSQLLAGRDPYDVADQAAIQQALGWDRDRDGFGIYEFVPYFYPPWFAMLCTALVPLGFEAARTLWLSFNVTLIVLGGYLLRDQAAPVRPGVVAAAVPLFALSVLSVVMGQTSPLVFFLLAAAWRLLGARRDGAAGAVLAGLTFKPQLTVILAAALFLWAARQRRWGLHVGFSAALLVLVGASTILLPDWPVRLLRAPKVTPIPTDYFPQMGGTWLLVLRTWGVPQPYQGVLYATVAIPFLAVVLRAAWDPARPPAEVLSVSLLAVFLVVPYCQAYDYVVLLVPLLVTLNGRIPPGRGAALLFAVLALPYLQIVWMIPADPVMRWGRLFWIPVLLTGVWAVTRNDRSGSETASPARPER